LNISNNDNRKNSSTLFKNTQKQKENKSVNKYCGKVSDLDDGSSLEQQIQANLLLPEKNILDELPMQIQ